MHTNQPYDEELLANLLDDQATSDLSGGALKPKSIQAARSRGEWPYDTYYIGRKPYTDKRQYISGILASRVPGKGVAA